MNAPKPISPPLGHTPGPWEWAAGIIPPDGPGRYSDIYVLDEDREPIILAEFNDSISEGRANACLMTAAPELREAVAFLLPRVDRHHAKCSIYEAPECNCEQAARWDAARAALAKATGIAPSNEQPPAPLSPKDVAHV